MKFDDVRLIEMTLAGDDDAFGELVTRYQDRLVGTLFRLLGSIHDARDVAQEAFLLAYQKLETFRKEASFYSWLFRIAYNAAMTNRRKLKLRSGSLDRDYELTGHEPADVNPAVDPSHKMQTEEQIQEVRRALNQLSSEYRDAIVLKEFEGMRYEEIAIILECPIGTVRSRIHRARYELREILERGTTPEPGVT